MRLVCIPFLLLLISTLGLAQDSQPQSMPRHDLMPAPASIQFEDGQLAITNTFSVASPQYSSPRLEAAILRANRRLEAHAGIQFAPGLANDAGSATLVVDVQRAGEKVQSIDEVESYTLDVTPDKASLKAETEVGAMRGLETFLQLVEGGPEGYFIPAVKIADQPRFRWRGLMIDVSRHWEPVNVIKRNLDGMAAVKLNVFHWHLSDDQGFRVESKKYPKLQEMGSDGLYYTQEQIRDVVAYARARGIRVVPEFDLPAHATSWVVGYPELASAPGPYSIERRYGIFDPTLDPTREETYKFLDGFIAEMAQLFPDPYMHIGGDENNGKQWGSNPKIQAFMKAKGIKTSDALQAYFNQRLQKILEKHGKKMVGWDEILQPELPKDIVVQSWRGEESLSAGAKQGYQGILSAPYYLDQIYPASQHYLADPLPASTDLTPDQQKLILGGEACMWAEHITPDTIDSRIWPRMAAIAERFWSPREVNDVPDMYRRLDRESVRLEELGLQHVSHTDAMVRRAAQADDITSFRVLTDTLQPVTFSQRSHTQKTTQLTPMTHLVDAVNPDPASGRKFAALVDSLLNDAPNFASRRTDLEHVFQGWNSIQTDAGVLLQESPLLREAEPRMAELSQIGQAGLEALVYLSSGATPPAGWKEAKLAMLDEAAKSKVLVRFVVLNPMRQLIVAASEVSTAGTMPVSEWKTKVVQEAAPPSRRERD